MTGLVSLARGFARGAAKLSGRSVERSFHRLSGLGRLHARQQIVELVPGFRSGHGRNIYRFTSAIFGHGDLETCLVA